MIEVIPAEYAPLYPDTMRQMFRLRHDVFCQKLGWVKPSDDGLERDRFDRRGAIYLVSLDDHEDVDGCWRLLPTTEPNMLSHVFHDLCPDHQIPSDRRTWETSRFAVASLAGARPDLRAMRRATVELFCALGEFCERARVEQIVTVHDAFIARLIDRVVGYSPDWSYGPTAFGKTKAIVAGYRVQENILNEVRKRFGIEGSVVRNWVGSAQQIAA